MKKHPRSLWITSCLCFLVLAFSMCLQKEKPKRDPRGGAFAGSGRCMNCHKEIYTAFLHTAHATSTQPASRASILGSFARDSNLFRFRPGLQVEMQQRDSGFYQVAYSHDTAVEAAPFDIVVGSGRKAQTYLYWQGDKVFQLPVSFSVASNTWANSPNYPSKQVRFDRNIPEGCFECHGSFIRKTSTQPEGDRLVDHFDRSQIVYGIDCERCHGPAAHHADFHEANPVEKTAQFITGIRQLSRQNKVEMCAVCHSGLTAPLQTLFTFQPGSRLSDYMPPDTSHPRTNEIDVHGKQYQLLQSSQCYLKSDQMTCSSCHNPHSQERDNLAVFSQRCMTCHNEPSHTFCPLAPKVGKEIVNDCIDCHMPARPSRLITLLSQGQQAPTPAIVRTHLIAVYQEETKQFMKRKLGDE